MLGQPGPLYVLAKDLPGAHPCQRLSARVEHQLSLTLPLFQARAELAKVDGDRTHGAATHRDEAFLAPLPEDADESLLEEDISHRELDPFRDAQPGSIPQLEHRPV